MNKTSHAKVTQEKSEAASLTVWFYTDFKTVLFSFESISVSAGPGVVSISVTGGSDGGGRIGSFKSTMCEGDGVRLGAEEVQRESNWWSSLL